MRLSLPTTYISLCLVATALGKSQKWEFVQNGTSGILALEAIFVSPTKAIFFDLGGQPNAMTTANGAPAWGAVWDMETNTATALELKSDTFCASGALLSNGTMVSVGGNLPFFGIGEDGRMALRLLEPQACGGVGEPSCNIIESPELRLAENRWYPSSIRIFDGSLLIVGGSRISTPFYNVDPINSYEFFPPKDGGVPRASQFLERSLPANMFPRAFALPDGKVFIAANNQSIIYDIETNEETILPDIPNGVRVTNPFDGTATLLPLHPPHYIPEILVCGGSNSSDLTPSQNFSSQTPASDQCSRLTLTPEGIARGWEVEHMLEGRMMPEMILLPSGEVLIINGATTGYAAFNGVPDVIGNSNADHPALTPSIYTPSAQVGKRISNKGLPTAEIPRMYHSVASLTPQGNILLAGSNPNPGVFTEKYATEYRVEYLNPPYISGNRPVLHDVPAQISFNEEIAINVTIPKGLKLSNIKVALMDLGFSSHAFHSSSRLVFLEANLKKGHTSLTIRAPPNNRVFPPGPGYIFLTVDGSTSVGAHVMVGNGGSPPVNDQGVAI